MQLMINDCSIFCVLFMLQQTRRQLIQRIKQKIQELKEELEQDNEPAEEKQRTQIQQQAAEQKTGKWAIKFDKKA